MASRQLIDFNSGDQRGIFLLIGTFLHLMEADSNVPLAAFTEYAADRNWIASHLMQLTGMGLRVSALVHLSQRMAAGQAKVVAILGEIGAVVYVWGTPVSS